MAIKLVDVHFNQTDNPVYINSTQIKSVRPLEGSSSPFIRLVDMDDNGYTTNFPNKETMHAQLEEFIKYVGED